jgi:hypothetical protein
VGLGIFTSLVLIIVVLTQHWLLPLFGIGW